MAKGYPLRLALPLLLAIAVAGWTGYWFYAQARVQHAVDRGAERLQANGGGFVCEDRQWHGFPLRLVLSCARTKLDVPGGPVVETANLEAAGQLYDARRILVQTGGLTVEGAPGWSIALGNLALSATVRHSERLEFAASGETFRLADGRLPPVALDGLAIEGAIDGLPRRGAPDFATLLREAARLGTRVTIDSFKAGMAGIEVTGSGSLALGPGGPTGTISTTVSDYEALLADLERRGAISSKAVRASSMMIDLLQGGKKTAGEATIALRFHEGQVFWGPFAIARLPPLE